MTIERAALTRGTARLEKSVVILKAIAHPIRLEVLEILDRYGESSVKDIQDKFTIHIDQPLLSHHLIKLKDKGILDSSKNGANVVYRLIDSRIMQILIDLDNCKL